MDSITLKRAVTLVVIVTEDFKAQILAEVRGAMNEVDQTVHQLDTQSRRYLLELQRTNLQQAMAVRQQVDQERQKHMSVRAELERQQAEFEKLELGSEFRRGTLEGLVDVSVGDNLMLMVNGAEVVMKDGIIQELRYVDLDDSQSALQESSSEEAASIAAP